MGTNTRLLILLTDAGAEGALPGFIDGAGGLAGERTVLMISHSLPGDTPAREVRNGVEVLRLWTPTDRGPGGRQKLGLRFAIARGFGAVACVSDARGGVGEVEDLARLVTEGKCDAALKVGRGRGLERLLRFAQERLLGIKEAGFVAGNRVYAVRALEKIPFERNGEDFRFDTEIVIQMASKGFRVEEVAGEEGKPVGLEEAYRISRLMLRAAFHRKALLYDRKYDVEAVEETYDLKLGFPSSHTFAIAAARPGARILDLGCGRGYVAREFAKKAAMVTATDRYEPGVEATGNLEFRQWDLDGGEAPVDVSRYDQIFLLDIVEHLKDPEEFLERLRISAARTRPEIILTTANIAFFVTRILLILGHFNYGRKGILDRTHTRLFTLHSLRELLAQTGYAIEEVRGIPAPYARVLGVNGASRALAWLNGALIRLSPGIFAYQIYVRARANPTVQNLLAEIEGGEGDADGRG